MNERKMEVEVVDMTRQRLTHAVCVFFLLATFAAGPACVAAQSSPGKTTAQEVTDKVAEAARAIKNYSVEQRDEAAKKAKAALDDMDARISQLESENRKKWDEMDQSARQKAGETMADLRKKRNETAEWYGGLKHSSSKAWEDVKTGFVKSYQDLRDAFEKGFGKR